jgi:hypothetical protein
MDFMSDQLFNGQRFRLLTLVDNMTRESLEDNCGWSLGPREAPISCFRCRFRRQMQSEQA